MEGPFPADDLLGMRMSGLERCALRGGFGAVRARSFRQDPFAKANCKFVPHKDRISRGSNADGNIIEDPAGER